MTCILIITLLLCTLVSLSLSQNSNEPQICCFDFFKSRIPEKTVKHFTETDERCVYRGVIFHTVKKRERCVDPSLPWVKKIMKNLLESSFKKIKGYNKLKKRRKPSLGMKRKDSVA